MIKMIRRYCAPNRTESRQTLQCSFSSVSTPTIARVGAFFRIFRDLQDFHAFAPLRAQNFGHKLPYFLLISTEKSQKFAKFRSKFGKFSRNFAGISRKFRGAKGSRSSRVLPGFFPGSSRVLPDVLQFFSRPMPSTVRPFS